MGVHSLIKGISSRVETWVLLGSSCMVRNKHIYFLCKIKSVQINVWTFVTTWYASQLWGLQTECQFCHCFEKVTEAPRISTLWLVSGFSFYTSAQILSSHYMKLLTDPQMFSIFLRTKTFCGAFAPPKSPSMSLSRNVRLGNQLKG